MPVRVPNRPVCHHCDGFPVVSITIGAQHHNGSRVLLRVICPACQGTGHTAPAPVLVRAGR
jgi:DnaJ-class molecular chaperone